MQVTTLGNGAAEVAAGGGHTCARKQDGTLWCWGYDGDGELGDASTTHEPTPVQVKNLTCP